MMLYKGAERRRYQRANANFLVSYRTLYPNGSFNLSQTKNISQGGMLLVTSEGFSRETILVMFAQFPFFTERVKITAKVVRNKEIAKGFIYETGLEFISLTQSAFNKLGEFVRGG
jgi:c-di-GMP-binding flagellar brake protein YcgR